MHRLLYSLTSILIISGSTLPMDLILKPQLNEGLDMFDLSRKGSAAALIAFLDAHPTSDINKQFTDFFKGYTPLHFACLQGNEETARVLIERGAHVEGIDGQEPTPLMLAAAGGSKALCRMILEKDPSLKSTDQATKALYRAVSEGHTELVNFFIDEEIPCDLQEALSIATSAGNQELADLFVAHGAKINTEKPALQPTGLLLPYLLRCINLYKAITNSCCKKRKSE